MSVAKSFINYYIITTENVNVYLTLSTLCHFTSNGLFSNFKLKKTPITHFFHGGKRKKNG